MPSCVENGEIQIFVPYGGRDSFEKRFFPKEKARIAKDIEKIKEAPKPSSYHVFTGDNSEETALKILKEQLSSPSQSALDIYFTRIEVSRKGRGFNYEVSVRRTDEGSHSSSSLVRLFYSSKDLKN